MWPLSHSKDIRNLSRRHPLKGVKQQSNEMRFKFLEDYNDIVEEAEFKVCQAGVRELF